MSKNYDNIDVVQLLGKSVEVDYPLGIMILRLQLHRSPRGLKCYDHRPGAVLLRSGIIAGCSQSTSFTKILLFDMFKFLWNGYETSQAYGLSYCPQDEDTADVSSSVGDLKTTTHEVSDTHVEMHENMGANLILDLKGLRAKVSKKNVILGRKNMRRPALLDTMPPKGSPQR